MEKNAMVRLLREFPWLWAIESQWHHDHVIKVQYAPNDFLNIMFAPWRHWRYLHLDVKFAYKNRFEVPSSPLKWPEIWVKSIADRDFLCVDQINMDFLFDKLRPLQSFSLKQAIENSYAFHSVEFIIDVLRDNPLVPHNPLNPEKKFIITIFRPPKGQKYFHEPQKK